MSPEQRSTSGSKSKKNKRNKPPANSPEEPSNSTDQSNENEPTETTSDAAQDDADNDEKTLVDGTKALSVTDAISQDKFDALVRDRDSLRAEVIEMRKSLEEIQHKHQEEMGALQRQLAESESKKEHAETQFQKLLERVNTIKSQLGERLKEDAEEIEQAKSRIDELEKQNSGLQAELDEKTATIKGLREQAVRQSDELSSLRERTTLSQQNWFKEREELLEQEAYLRSEFEEAKQAMHNWEVLAMEERSIRESLADRVADLEDRLGSLKEEYEKVASENHSQSVTIDGLQRALQEIQDARKQELRELVQSSDAQLEEVRTALREAEKRASEAESSLQEAQTELERLRPFEKEVREKNLLIGKLRHEAVTLNDHLTKALRFLKRGRPEDNVDRHIVTNHLLHFLALDRSDPRKFQILQLIAALLQWTDEQKEQAGLTRPGASNPSGANRHVGISMHRTPSTPSLGSEYLESNSSGKESLAELWSNFLEQEAQGRTKSP